MGIMQVRSIRQILGTALLLALSWNLSLAPAYADADTDLRPSWSASQYQLQANSSLLFLNRDPGFVGTSFQNQLINPKKGNELRQNLEDRNRNYDMRSTYGIATQQDEADHAASMKDMAKVVVNSARNSQAQQYGRNVGQAQQEGQVSQPLVVVGGAASLGMGTPIDLQLSDSTKATWHGDAMQRHGQLDLVSPDVGAKVEMNGKSDAVERYQVSVSKPLPLGFGSGFGYGGTSNVMNASLGHPIYDKISGTVGASIPTGNNPTGAVQQETVGVSYGLTF
jgi:hypothetical protein